MTDLVVEVREADAEDALRSLAGWLRADESLDGQLRSRVAPAAPAPADHMGTGFDVLELVLGSSLSTAALVVSLLQWQLSRRRAPALVLSRGDVRVELTPEAARDEETLRRVMAVLERGEGGAADGDGAS
ncbi:effector-associated constant component EACC1 [Streptomyces sp. G5(2025)]|uniref:effector-associated constant component EACC1 n=1 Tax=Streptomyces sp. G5(2025) TaxID=3406628 RepID=UPI003C1DEA4C